MQHKVIYMYVCNTYRAGAAPDDEKSLPEVRFMHTESLDINLVGSLQLFESVIFLPQLYARLEEIEADKAPAK